MGLIIKDKIRKMIKGFPTVSDKYNIGGATLAGTDAVHFGDLVGYGTVQGTYKKLSTVTAATDVAGIVVGTNVKLADVPSNDVKVYPGEAFNLLIDGFVAVQLASTADTDDITPNAAVAVNATGGITTPQTSGTFNLPNTVFTGTWENIGTATSPVILAEIYVK